MSQMHIFNFFPGSIHSSRILKTLSLFASRQKNTYLSNQQVWLNKLYFQISNLKEKQCLTIDTREINELGPGKFRKYANDGEEQTCYFNRNKSDTHFTSFLAKRTRTKLITFSVVKVSLNCELVNKSLDIERNSSLPDGRAKRHFQEISAENLNNGRLKTDILVAESKTETGQQQQRGDQREILEESQPEKSQDLLKIFE